MKVELADKAGFCFGVTRAMDLVEDAIRNGEKPIFTYGPMIHNEEVIRDLEAKGVRVIHSAEEIASLSRGTVIIRSHGVTQEEYLRLKSGKLHVVDGTCPYVQRIHRLAADYSSRGYQIVIIGNPKHPEVAGICGWCKKKPHVIQTAPEAENLNLNPAQKVCILAQTTFNFNKFQELVDILNKKGYDNTVCNTICVATKERQDAARVLSAKVDAMIVIGGKESSNTRKLYEICSEECPQTCLIQTKDDLDVQQFQRFDYVGITAGASTPNNIIEEVQTYVRKEF